MIDKTREVIDKRNQVIDKSNKVIDKSSQVIDKFNKVIDKRSKRLKITLESSPSASKIDEEAYEPSIISGCER